MSKEKEEIDMLKRPSLRHFALFVACGLLLAYFVFSEHGDGSLQNGSLAPLSTVVSSYDGKQWSLALFAGKPLLVNFWATWCPPCVEELPQLAEAARLLKDKVQLIGLAVDSPAHDVGGLVERFGVTYPVAAVTNKTLESWHSHALPATYLIDAAGKVVWKQVGPTSLAEIKWAVETYLPH